jgi:hypothetical protein
MMAAMGDQVTLRPVGEHDLPIMEKLAGWGLAGRRDVQPAAHRPGRVTDPGAGPSVVR